MDTDDLIQLAHCVEAHGLDATVDEAESRLLVTNPLNSRLTEEIHAVADGYVTSFDYEIGERGQERECAERIARILAVGTAGSSPERGRTR
ncbi:hypothetical protein [Streptomyces sp. NPDC059009]|uniref:hypothetical protein n=1 Tax=Streptomyces sp. NPDC059009 TaxID=3346694 RepID=UPI0036BD38EC